MSLLATIASTAADIGASGGIGTLLGGIMGIGQKIWQTKLEHEERQHQRTHELDLLKLQHSQEAVLARYSLHENQVTASGAALEASYQHDTSFESSSYVSDIRALVRPAITLYAIVAAGFNPEVYSGFAGVMISWWFSSRIQISKPYD